MQRRQVLQAGLAAIGGLSLFEALAADATGLSIQGTTVNPDLVRHVSVPTFQLPAGSCDCHVHVFDGARFPFAARRSYTPGAARVEDLIAFEQRLGIDRIVLVQPSVYGFDNAALLDALGRLGERARGVAVIDLEATTHAALQAMHGHGVRGIRLNLEVSGQRNHDFALTQLKRAEQLIGPFGWAVQVYADVDVIAELATDIAALRVPVVLDHFAGIKTYKKDEQKAAFASVVELVKRGNAYVKLSAPYRASRSAPGFDDVTEFARALIQARPDRLVWASDWPHTGSSGNRSGNLEQIEPFRKEDAGRALDQLASWANTPALLQRILVDNPARLYGFGRAAA
ncbi:amidohydrolase family protein [Cupriavidus numazuensis]|uniref:4-sulfomuconolactone hydrolase n=1 Tax=Cupriavidus numazuensis TaxID=221992 RepID=A0ABN7Q7R6_9BURK|nr:amidohydrolase family protein [Cupriavidus numazuensis]CAG2153636.1 4-sulfomuconolactone hydrolase [Cupriavidus numazuensis]